MLPLAFLQLKGNILGYFEHWDLDELQFAVPQKRRKVVDSPSKLTKCIPEKPVWFSKYMCNDVRIVHDCYSERMDIISEVLHLGIFINNYAIEEYV